MESRDKEINRDVDVIEALDTVEASDVAPQDSEALTEEAKKPLKPFLKRVKESEIWTDWFKVLVIIFLASAVIYILSRFIKPFAEFWTQYPAQGIRFLLAKLTGWIPFSLAEFLIISLPVMAIAYIVASSVSTKRDKSNKNYYKWLRPLVSVVLVIITLFFAGFGPAYSRNKLAENLGLEQKPVSADDLYLTGKIIAREATDLIADIDFDVSGASVMPYDYQELVKKVNAAFEKYAAEEEYISHFYSNPKAIALSEPMTYTHISGVYTFMTGESNINTNYPDFLMPFTMAHEMAHQRGIAREDEANFVAFLVCISSDDAYIRYSGYANLANYITSALYSADSSKYIDLMSHYLPIEIAKEFAAYSNFFEKYRESTASSVTGAVNNVFLQSQGQSAGTKSYGLVVDLAVAYYK